MNDDELARRLGEAFDAQTRACVSDHAMPPVARYLEPPKRHRARRYAPLAAAAAVLAVVAAALLVQNSTRHGHRQAVAGHSTPAAAPRVRMRLLTADGRTYGVGMPVVAVFSERFASAKPLASATSVTVNGKPVRAAWYFDRSSAVNGYPIEGHLRMRSYWPAHADIHVSVAANEVTGGATVDFRTGAKNVALVIDAKHQITISSDGKRLGSYPVSLGASSTPTSHGVKVIMQKGVKVCMQGPGYNDCGIKFTQRLTYSGEYLHAAPWNTYNIDHGVDSSNGCTNLRPTDAARLYKLLNVGDIVEYPDARGPAMTMGEGYGDWNVPWRVWLKGGLIPTS